MEGGLREGEASAARRSKRERRLLTAGDAVVSIPSVVCSEDMAGASGVGLPMRLGTKRLGRQNEEVRNARTYRGRWRREGKGKMRVERC